MTRRLHSTDNDFQTHFTALLAERGSFDASIKQTVSSIIDDVRARGDDAVLELTKKFDFTTLTQQTMRLSQEQIDAAAESCPSDVCTALQHAADRIRAYHGKQRPKNERWTDDSGTTLGWRWSAVDAAGLYVPGGRASYPSSVLMNAIPAQVAGVTRLAMVVPAPNDVLNPAVLVAAKLAGVTEIYTIGGAQAVAALAYGTATIAPVDVIVGPGNAYVAEAKRQVYGQVGIDSIAGPSEILVVADSDNTPAWIAADLLSQAEHDPVAQSILITDDKSFADNVADQVTTQLGRLPKASPAHASWQNYGAIITVPSLSDALPLIDYIAPEHLELAIADPDSLAAKIRHAGAIFLGRHTPEPIGDYIAGPSHVLPTSRAARYASGLSVYDFMKRTSLIRCSAESLKAIGEDAAKLADSEGLPAHAHSIRIRQS